MYSDGMMKRLQICIEQDLDEALATEAERQRTSKAALIRQFVRDRLRPQHVHDPMDDLVGSIDAEPANVDDVAYGPR